MPVTGRNVVVVGTSAGGLDALEQLLRGLPTGIPAAIFIVQHLAPEVSGDALVRRLAANTALPCRLARDGEAWERGHVYMAPPDNHLLVKGQHLLVTKGARENRSRPGIDPLFRSAAVSHGPRVIGVVLTGMLDDGTAGLVAIRKCGGVTVVQDPGEAAYPAMPQSALANLKVDHCVRLAVMGALLDELSRARAGRRKAIPEDIRTEARIAERVLSDVSAVNGLGDLVPYNCPNCGGTLWEMAEGDGRRFRCHTGHSFTTESLLVSQNEKIEETLWVALRMFEERKNLLNGMGTGTRGLATVERVREAEAHIERIRAMLRAPSVTERANGKEGGRKARRSPEQQGRHRRQPS